MIGIYQFKNIINNKIYIGQSKNIECRYQRHLYDAKNGATTLLHAAIRKYGIENFTFTILEECKIEELNIREIFYIKTFNSLMPNGYNVQTGGQDRKNQPYFHFTESDIIVIYDLLKDTELSYVDIGQIYGVSSAMIKHINYGEEYAQDEIQYPIRSEAQSKNIQKKRVSQKLSGENSYRATITTEQVYDIINDLTFNLQISIVDIAKKYSTTIDVVKDINRFKSWKHIVRNVPCRPDFGNHKITLEDAKFIIKKLKEPITIKDICALNPLYTYKIVYRINIGENWKQENEQYPIRTFRIITGKLTIPQVFQIYDELALQTPIFLIAKKFNLSEQSIRDIANNKSYSYLRQFYNNHM